MATVRDQRIDTPPRRSFPERRFDHLFFCSMTWLMLVTVFVGFAPSYYLAGVLRSPLPSSIIHIHAIVFSLWIVVLIAQTGLTAGGRISVHRKLGIAGFALALLMLMVGLWAATDSLARGVPAPDPLGLYIIPTTNIVAFTVLILFAYRARFDSGAHKRIVIIASTALMTAPIARWRFDWSHHGRFIHTSLLRAECFSYAFVLLLIAYDFLVKRRIHRATIWGSSFLVAIQQVALQFGKTAIWHSIAGRVQAMVQH